jgi:hypothetical protein
MNSLRTPGRFLSVIAAHPVAAFVVIAILLSWAGQILSMLLLGNILPGILAELLILLGTAVLVTAAADGRPAVRKLLTGHSVGGWGRAGMWQRCWVFPS